MIAYFIDGPQTGRTRELVGGPPSHIEILFPVTRPTTEGDLDAPIVGALLSPRYGYFTYVLDALSRDSQTAYYRYDGAEIRYPSASLN